MFLFWTLVVICGLGFRLLHYLNRNLDFSEKQLAGSSRIKALHRRLNRKFQQYILVPAAFSRHCAEPLGWWIVPPRLQSLIILTFVLLNFVLSFGHYDIFAANLYWPDTRLQYARYVGDRTGVMGTANLTLIYLFATRNNILLWVTGWSFETFMQFHRWVARVSTIQAIVHSLAYTVYVLLAGGLQHYWSVWLQAYWSWGAVATVCMSLLLVFSLYPLRSKLYELFLFLHMTLAVAVLVGMWYHVAIFDGAYNIFLWPCLIIWIADRLIRMVRIVRCNIPYRNTLATYSPETNVIWLNIPRVTATTPQPGSYYFIYLMHGTSWYESHPFTLSGWELGALDHTQHTDTHERKRLHKINLQFVIRPYDGLTSRLRDLVNVQSGESKTGRHLRVLVEGPYGPKHGLRRYETIAFIVGGTGIAIALSYLSDILDLARTKTDGYRVRRLHIVWAVREPALFQETIDRELGPRLMEISKLSDGMVDARTQIYNTTASTEQTLNGEPSTDSSEMEPMFSSGVAVESQYQVQEWEADEHSPLSSSAGVVTPDGMRLSIFNHRPRLENVVLQCASANGERRSCAIVACCPAGMADDARAAVVKVIGQGYDGIDFYPESYAW